MPEPDPARRWALIATAAALAVAVVIVLVILLGRHSNSPAPSPRPTVSATAATPLPTPSATPSATPTSTPPPTPTPAPSATATPPPPTAPPATMAPLGAPPPGSPATGIDASGTGNGRVPAPAKSAFMIQDNWQISYAWTCPPNLGSGMTPTFIVTVQPGVPGLMPNDPPAQGLGPSGQAAQLEPHGATVYLQITTASPSCQWHVVVYGSVA